jgi:flagellar hook assembly protein FlgD
MPRAPATLEAEILDSSGRVIARPMVAPSATGSLSWDGSLPDSGRAPEGAYVLKLVAKDSSGKAMASDLTTLGRVQEVVARDGATWLGLAG